LLGDDIAGSKVDRDRAGSIAVRVTVIVELLLASPTL